MGNICIVSRPELTDEEREQRMERIKRAATKLIIAAERKEQKP